MSIFLKIEIDDDMNAILKKGKPVTIDISNIVEGIPSLCAKCNNEEEECVCCAECKEPPDKCVCVCVLCLNPYKDCCCFENMED